MKKEQTKKANDEQRAAVREWEDDGGAAPSAGGLIAETQRQESVGRAGRRAAFEDSRLRVLRS